MTPARGPRQHGFSGRVLWRLMATAAAIALYAQSPIDAFEVGEGATEVRVSSALELLDDSAVIDWGYGVVEAPGTSDLAEPSPSVLAAGEARRAAVARMAEVLRRLRVTGDVTLGAAADRIPELAADIGRIAARAGISREVQGEAGRVTATARLNLFADASGVAEAVLLHLGGELGPARSAGSGEIAAMTRDVLTVDARGFGLQPCLLPRFLLSDGTPLRTYYADTVRLERRPPVAYVRTREELSLRQSGRLVTHVRAAGVGGAQRTDIVLLRPVDLEMPQEILVLY